MLGLQTQADSGNQDLRNCIQQVAQELADNEMASQAGGKDIDTTDMERLLEAATLVVAAVDFARTRLDAAVAAAAAATGQGRRNRCDCRRLVVLCNSD